MRKDILVTRHNLSFIMSRNTHKSILMIEHVNTYAGGQSQYIEMIEALSSEGFDIGAMFPKGGKLSDRFFAANLSVDVFHYFALRLSTGTKNILDVFRILLNIFFFSFTILNIRKYEIWHVNGGRVLLPAVFFGFILRRDVIFHAHLNFSPFSKRFLLYLLEKGFLTKIFCCSDHIRSQLLSYSKNSESRFKITTIENGLPIWASNLRYDMSRQMSDQKNIAIIGTISSNKGQIVSLDLLKAISDINIYLFGEPLDSEGAYFNNLLAATQDRLHLMGYVDNIQAALSENSISVVLVPTTIDEPFGLVAIESIACSCYVITSSVGGLEDISNKVGFPTYTNYIQLVQLISDFFALPSNQRQEKAQLLHLNVMSQYSYSKFKNNFLKEIAAMCVS